MLNIFHYRLLLQTQDRVPGYYLGSAWRGAFGHALLALDESAYRQVFEVKPPTGMNETFGQTPPQPYVLSPSQYISGMDRTAWLELDFVLMGPAHAHINTCIDALQIASRNIVGCKFSSLQIFHYHPSNGFAPFEKSMARAITAESAPSPAVTAYFELQHPLRLRNREGKNLCQNEMNAPDWSMATVRRLRQLEACYGIAEIDHQPAVMQTLCNSLRFESASFKWQDQSRHSQRQERDVPLGGVIGNASLKGDGLHKLWPTLWLGQWLHTGKGAVMGMGRYSLTDDKQ